MTDRLNIRLSRELIDHFLNDSFWDIDPDAGWPETELPKQEEKWRLNSGELPCHPDEFVIECCNHPELTEVDLHNFQCCHVLTFRWKDPREGRSAFAKRVYHGKYYKFDIWTPGPVVHYEAMRWSDEPWSG